MGDLRARRRADTSAEIHRAALELFEEHGVQQTTVQQIAERARVSPRTFFRYFSSKEQAALPGQRRLLRAIEALDVIGCTPAEALGAVEDAARIVLAAENDPELDERRRVALLLAKEPDLAALAAAQEEILIQRLGSRLEQQLGGDRLTARLVADVAFAVWRASWRHWGELSEQGEMVDPADCYRDCLRALRAVVGEAE